MADVGEFGWMAWPERLRPIPFDTEKLGFDPNKDTSRAGQMIQQLENSTLVNDVLENKLLAIIWHNRSFIDLAGKRPKATWEALHQWLWAEFQKDIRPAHLRLRVMIVDIFVPFGLECEAWIEEFQLTVAGRLADLTRTVFKKQFDGKQVPLQMSDDEIEQAAEIVKKIMITCPAHVTTFRDVQNKFVDALKLLNPQDVPDYQGRGKAKTDKEMDIDAEIIRRIRESRDGLIGPPDDPIFILEDGPAVSATFEIADRDWALAYCKEHNITRGALRRQMIDYFKAHHMKTGKEEAA